MNHVNATVSQAKVLELVGVVFFVFLMLFVPWQDIFAQVNGEGYRDRESYVTYFLRETLINSIVAPNIRTVV